MVEVIKEAGKVLASKKKGKGWVEEALPVVVGVAKEIKTLESTKGEEVGPLRELINSISNKYKGALDALGEMDTRLRERVMKEYGETESIKQDGVGELVFPERWSYEVTDIKRVDPQFLMVDGKAVNEEIKKGVRKIRGIEIIKLRSLQVRPESNKTT